MSHYKSKHFDTMLHNLEKLEKAQGVKFEVDKEHLDDMWLSEYMELCKAYGIEVHELFLRDED